MKLYLLCEYTYDYYEFCEPFLVSNNEDALIKYCVDNNLRLEIYEIGHCLYADGEINHYYINEIEYLEVNK